MFAITSNNSNLKKYPKNFQNIYLRRTRFVKSFLKGFFFFIDSIVYGMGAVACIYNSATSETAYWNGMGSFPVGGDGFSVCKTNVI